MIRAVGAFALTAVALLLPPPAQAAGGAHVVDDAGVETPGVCHLESWGTRLDRRSGVLVFAPACTRKRWSRLEIGGFLQRSATDGARQTVIGPALQLALSRDDAPARIGVLATPTIQARNGRIDGASILMPITIAVSARATVNVNAGYIYSRFGDRDASFVGVQLDRALTGKLGFMVEAFARDRGKPGFQTGLRWTPVSWIDIDALVGSRLDGTSPRALTIGLTLRR